LEGNSGWPKSLEQWLIKRIGVGDTMHIWNENWIPNTRTMHPMGHLIETSMETVDELITNDH
jgi:hypothetical protein